MLDEPQPDKPDKIPGSVDINGIKELEEGTLPARPTLLLGLRHNVPFEHEVILYKDLHIRLQDEVSYILKYRNCSRIGLISKLLGPSLTMIGMPELGKEFDKFPWTAIIGVFQGGFIASAELERDASLGRDKSILPIIRGLANIAIPYIIPYWYTIKFGDLIKEIASNGQSPFFRNDSPELLRKFHLGMIDDKGNIVLIKHPRDFNANYLSYGDELLLRMAWHQPFHRQMFKLNGPLLRPKQRIFNGSKQRSQQILSSN